MKSSDPDYYTKRYAEERKINIYFIPYHSENNGDYFAYVAASALLHDQFMAAMEYNQVPDFAVVLERGPGQPSDEIKQKMKDYYGFDHAIYEQYLDGNQQ